MPARPRKSRRFGGDAAHQRLMMANLAASLVAAEAITTTEAKAKASGRKIKVGRFPFIGNGKAIALGEAEGLVKTVFDAETGELLGAHMIGAEVTELIQGYTIARAGELTDEVPVGVDDRGGFIRYSASDIRLALCDRRKASYRSQSKRDGCEIDGCGVQRSVY